ncbi:MAG: 4Fe-4S binding protein [Sulfurimonas sp.]|jgi:ferredoxin-type protein NapF|nr:4Fe-4S binding protein [Sulfurimonas sp.]
MQRRELFSFLSLAFQEEKPKKEKKIRPPYVVDNAAFETECQKCDAKCATLCQEQIIIIGEDKSPYLDLSKSGCTYCDACALGCEFEVLSLDAKTTIDAFISIDEAKCISHQGVMCFSCKDPCLEDAIIFHAMFMPHIDQDKCTSCGFCISRCPTYAINIGEKSEDN